MALSLEKRYNESLVYISQVRTKPMYELPKLESCEDLSLRNNPDGVPRPAQCHCPMSLPRLDQISRFTNAKIVSLFNSCQLQLQEKLGIWCPS